MNYVLYRSGAIPTGGKNSYKLQGIFLIRSQNVLDSNFPTMTRHLLMKNKRMTYVTLPLRKMTLY